MYMRCVGFGFGFLKLFIPTLGAETFFRVMPKLMTSSWSLDLPAPANTGHASHVLTRWMPTVQVP
jgi:hypothetical protein